MSFDDSYRKGCFWALSKGIGGIFKSFLFFWKYPGGRFGLIAGIGLSIYMIYSGEDLPIGNYVLFTIAIVLGFGIAGLILQGIVVFLKRLANFFTRKKQ